MSPLLIAMTLLGCSDAGDQCQAVRVLAPRYQTVDACNAAAEEILTRTTDVSYPVVAVHCQKADAPVVALASR
ncbi:hypothetical protein KZX46_08665 [Polymorphobacter sp. PAMC 29334]|uniref:hypothetical protein n=1 Tax=Polymorphobacter sp. PAMC 29334 TaxID=2862331 RepID=UPI001C76809C|nr:hypothetical protein [Polymorphobacter sp. PAMC 29334]QYE35993.1 hypothetical protein KZX46_08665 [Polymorphobacter sp. PAMC 29334]